MKTIDAARWSAASLLLDELLDMAPGDRGRRVEEVRTQDPMLADLLLNLLSHSDTIDRDRFLDETPAIPAAAPSLEGQVVGAYTIVRLIGQGGMGSVWLAARSDGRFEGNVAIKMLNLALVNRGGTERFEREGSILGRLTHPNIAQLFDAGVARGGQPYLVLEYVPGDPIDVHCDAQRIDVAGRIRLLLEVMAAVSYAHRNLVLHRDLKPSNILVTPQGRIKLLDFGIAKLLLGEHGTANPTALTQLAGRAFTPEYAAPEQVEGRDVNTATDVYALGVLLYALLSGGHPTTHDSDSPVGRLRAVTERVPRRLATIAEETEPGLAQRRSATPRQLARQLRGDLENIVGKALKKAPGERYATVDAFAEDLRRYLAGQPVSAQADSLRYRVTKFVQRNRLAVSLASLAGTALLAGLAGTLMEAQRATREAEIAHAHSVRADREAQAAVAQRDFALRQLARVDAVSDLNRFLLTDAVHSGRPIPAGELLERAERIVERQRGMADPARIDMLVALGLQYKYADREDKARALLARAYETSRAIGDPFAKASAGCAYGFTITGSEYERGTALVRKTIAEIPSDRAFNTERISCYSLLSEASRETGDTDHAIEYAEAAARLLGELPFPSTTWEIRVLMDRAEAYRVAGQYRKAIDTFATVGDRLAALGLEDTETATTLYNNWALSLHMIGRPLEAESLFRRAIANTGGAKDAAVSPMVLVNFARTLDRLDRTAEAARMADRAYLRARAAGDAIIVNQSLLLRAAIYRRLGRLELTRQLLTEAESRLKQMLPPGHLAFAAIASQWALLDQALGQRVAAQARADEAVRLARVAQPDGPLLAEMLRRRAELDLEYGRTGEALADARRAVELEKTVTGPEDASANLGMAYLVLGRALRAEPDRAAARSAFEAAVAQLRPALGATHEDTTAAASALAALAR